MLLFLQEVDFPLLLLCSVWMTLCCLRSTSAGPPSVRTCRSLLLEASRCRSTFSVLHTSASPVLMPRSKDFPSASSTSRVAWSILTVQLGDIFDHGKRAPPPCPFCRGSWRRVPQPRAGASAPRRSRRSRGPMSLLPSARELSALSPRRRVLASTATRSPHSLLQWSASLDVSCGRLTTM